MHEIEEIEIEADLRTLWNLVTAIAFLIEFRKKRLCLTFSVKPE